MKEKKKSFLSLFRNLLLSLSIFIAIVLAFPSSAEAQDVYKLIVEIKTADNSFAGTDDPIHLIIGGRDFNLDNPNKDDFERNNTDLFELAIEDRRFNIDLIREIGVITINKTRDSFFGGGWDFAGITIWAESQGSAPIYQNSNVNKTLDGDELQWQTTLNEPGWNLPQTPPFPPCITGDIDTGVRVDSDCDGISDESDSTFDQPPDRDGDGLPDLYEEQIGSNPDNPDTDGDGWWDGKKNRRSFLMLTEIECLDEAEDIGRDEIYLTSEDIRFPLATTLDNSWPMNDDTKVTPYVIVDTRVAAPETNQTPLSFKTRMRLREDDFDLFENPTDDTYKIFDVTWGEDETIEITHQDNDSHYILTFQSFTVPFADPTPLTQDSDDSDGDGLSDRDEFLLSTQDSTVQPSPPIEGFNGLADPGHKELFVEIDSVGSDNQVPFHAKQMVASQFYNHDITLRVDDGFFGGGGQQVLPYQETVTIDDLRRFKEPTDPSNTDYFADARNNLFRYGLFVERTVGEGRFGNAAGKNFIVANAPVLGLTLVAQYTPIVFMHEMGHTLNLCHRAGDKGNTVSATCPTPPNWSGCTQYCGVGQDSNTAMGSETTADLATGIIVSALPAIGAGIVIGGLIAFFVPGPVGIVIGVVVAVLVAFIGTLLGIANFPLVDFYQRFVNYHPNEWAALRFW